MYLLSLICWISCLICSISCTITCWVLISEERCATDLRMEDMIINTDITVPLYLASVTTWDSSRWNLLV